MSVVIALCTPELKPGAVKFNTQNIKNCICKAKKADLIVFPRLAVTGATCGSMFDFPLLISAAAASIDEIAAFSDKTIILGVPRERNGKVFDSVAVISDGKAKLYDIPKGITDIGKSELNYGEDEIPPLEIGDMTASILPSPQYTQSDLVVVPTVYPSFIGSTADMSAQILALPACAVVSGGKGESVSGKIMSGDKLISKGGKLIKAGYDDETLIEKIGKTKDVLPSSCQREISFLPLNDLECAEAFEIMGRGITGRMKEIGTNKVILGLSGGLDSTNVLVAAVLAFEKYKLDKRNIICVTMRGGASSKRTQSNSASLIEAFGVTGINVPIDAAVTLHMRSICHDKQDVVFENAQARERTQILLDLSNKYNALMLGTGDLSEICLGWSTFGGDQLSQYNPNCSLTKTAIRKLLRFYVSLKHNKAAGKIIDDVLNTPISPELLGGQETEAILGPYEVHDIFIREIVAKKRAPIDAISAAVRETNLSETDIKKHLKTFLSRLWKYQFKRNFGPDGVQLFAYDLTDLNIRSDFNNELWLEF